MGCAPDGDALCGDAGTIFAHPSTSNAIGGILRASLPYNETMDLSPSDRARKIRLILFDVDGVLTDGGIWLVPAGGSPVDEVAHPSGSQAGAPASPRKMVEAKGFSAHDGIGISLARIAGIQCGVITKRISEAVAMRARDLRLEYVYMGQSYKMHAVREIMQRESITLDQIAYAGDDVIDLPVMRACGLAIAVANARAQVKAAAHYITPNSGGYGAGRDAIEFILEAKEILNECIEKYINESTPIPASMDIGHGET